MQSFYQKQPGSNSHQEEELCPVTGEPIVAYNTKTKKPMCNQCIYREIEVPQSILSDKEAPEEEESPSKEIRFIAYVAQELQEKFNDKFSNYKQHLSKMDEIAPRSINQSLQKTVTTFFDSIEQELQKIQNRVNSNILQSRNLNELQRIMDSWKPMFGLDKNRQYETGKQEIENCIQQSHFTQVVKQMKHYNALIAEMKKNNAYMEKALVEGEKRVKKILVVNADEPLIGKRINNMVDQCLEIDIRGAVNQIKRQRTQDGALSTDDSERAEAEEATKKQKEHEEELRRRHEEQLRLQKEQEELKREREEQLRKEREEEQLRREEEIRRREEEQIHLQRLRQEQIRRHQEELQRQREEEQRLREEEQRKKEEELEREKEQELERQRQEEISRRQLELLREKQAEIEHQREEEQRRQEEELQRYREEEQRRREEDQRREEEAEARRVQEARRLAEEQEAENARRVEEARRLEDARLQREDEEGIRQLKDLTHPDDFQRQFEQQRQQFERQEEQARIEEERLKNEAEAQRRELEQKFERARQEKEEEARLEDLRREEEFRQQREALFEKERLEEEELARQRQFENQRRLEQERMQEEERRQQEEARRIEAEKQAEEERLQEEEQARFRQEQEEERRKLEEYQQRLREEEARLEKQKEDEKATLYERFQAELKAKEEQRAREEEELRQQARLEEFMREEKEKADRKAAEEVEQARRDSQRSDDRASVEEMRPPIADLEKDLAPPIHPVDIPELPADEIVEAPKPDPMTLSDEDFMKSMNKELEEFQAECTKNAQAPIDVDGLPPTEAQPSIPDIIPLGGDNPTAHMMGQFGDLEGAKEDKAKVLSQEGNNPTAHQSESSSNQNSQNLADQADLEPMKYPSNYRGYKDCYIKRNNSVYKRVLMSDGSVQQTLYTKLNELGLQDLNQSRVTSLPDGRVFVIGGVVDSSPHYTSRQFFQIKNDIALQMAPMNYPRASFGVAVNNPKYTQIFVIGGLTTRNEATKCCERFLADENKWKRLPEMKVAKFSPGVCFFNEGSVIYSYGGQVMRNGVPTPIDVIERLFKGPKGWEQVDVRLPRPAFDLGCMEIGNRNDMIVFGGQSEDRANTEVYKLNHSTGELSRVPTSLSHPEIFQQYGHSIMNPESESKIFMGIGGAHALMPTMQFKSVKVVKLN